jgi:hypothetical protein
MQSLSLDWKRVEKLNNLNALGFQRLLHLPLTLIYTPSWGEGIEKYMSGTTTQKMIKLPRSEI